MNKRNSDFFSSAVQQDLSRKSVHGAAITASAQIVGFVLRMASMVILARLLLPSDFGLVAMVSAVTGFVVLFKDAGLSMATIQRDRITHEQISTLFWINLGISIVLALILMSSAPLIAWFYGEPRLTGITTVLALALILSGVVIQHQALLRRQMRFLTISVIELVGQLAGIVAGVIMALKGFEYWALVGMTMTNSAVVVFGVWWTVSWWPGRPRRGSGIGSMVRFGGNLTAVNMLNYFSRNADNILIGWMWGPVMLGYYSRAYQILLLPMNQINRPLASVIIPALSRLQNQPDKFRSFFLNSFSTMAGLIVPIVLICLVYADEVVLILLGPNWSEVTAVFLLLVPAALAGALMSPMGWILAALGRVDRHLRVALWVSPLIVLSFIIGLRFGVRGVASTYSLTMVLLMFPIIKAMVSGTCVSVGDVFSALKYPCLAAVITSTFAWPIKHFLGILLPMFGNAVIGAGLIGSVYAFVLLIVFRQADLYLKILHQFRLKTEPSLA